jgi:hypothetical protein
MGAPLGSEQEEAAKRKKGKTGKREKKRRVGRVIFS